MRSRSLPVPQEGVRVGAVQRLGTGGEVDDARGPVGQDERQRQRGEGAAVAEPEKRRREVVHEV